MAVISEIKIYKLLEVGLIDFYHSAKYSLRPQTKDIGWYLAEK